MQFMRVGQSAPRRFFGEPIVAIAAVAVAVVVLLPIAIAREVRAQGFLDALFGKGPGYAPPPSLLRSRSAYIPFEPNMYLESLPAERTGTYRTLCVRHCDGYYWPVSSAVPPSRFYRDSGMCRESCGAEASLFYHAVNDDPADMVDLTGRSYASLPMAFSYRKSLVEDCKCKPEPWSQSEAERHRDYARDEAREDEMRAVATPATAAATNDVAMPAD